MCHCYLIRWKWKQYGNTNIEISIISAFLSKNERIIRYTLASRIAPLYDPNYTWTSGLKLCLQISYYLGVPSWVLYRIKGVYSDSEINISPAQLFAAAGAVDNNISTNHRKYFSLSGRLVSLTEALRIHKRSKFYPALPIAFFETICVSEGK